MEQQESDAGGWAWFLVLALVVCMGIFGGSLSCERRRETPPTEGQAVGKAMVPGPPVPLSGPALRGKQILDTVGCLGCHRVYNQGGTIGPDLSNYAAQERSPEWLRKQIPNQYGWRL